MKYLLKKKLKTKSVVEFASDDIQKVVDYTAYHNYQFTGFTYIGGFAHFTNGKHTFTIQGDVDGIVCSYDKSLVNVKPLGILIDQLS